MNKQNTQGTRASTERSRIAKHQRVLLNGLLLLSALLAPFISTSAYAQDNDALVCTAAKTGNPCMSPASSPQINIGAGNPIHLATGNKFQQETDLYMRPSGLEIVRYYNSAHTMGGANGAGWRQSYSTRLYKIGQRWQILTDDGRRIMFKAPVTDEQNNDINLSSFSSTASPVRSNTADKTQAKGAPTAYALDPNYGKLIWTQDGTWVWITPEAIVRTFNTHGHLVHQLVPAYLPVYIQRLRESGPRAELITRVQGGEESLLYHYEDLDGQARLVRIDSPIGIFSYHYEKPGAHPYYRLDKVIRIDQWQRQYHYEPERQAPDSPYLLTGLSLSTPQQETLRTNTWAYDEKGRANYSSVGFKAEDELHLDFVQEPSEPNSKGLTKVRDKVGNETQIYTTQIAGQYLVEKVTGFGCYLCPPVGTEASYDTHGRMVSINGHQISRNEQGYVTQIVAPHPSWGPLTINYDKENRVIAWNSPATGTETIEYNNQGQISRRKLANGTSYRYTYHPNGDIYFKYSKRKYQKTSRVRNYTPTLKRGYQISSRLSSYYFGRQIEEYPHFHHSSTQRVSHNLTYGHRYTITPRSAYETHYRLPEFGEITRHYYLDRAVKSIQYKPQQAKNKTLISIQENKINYGNQLELSSHNFFPNMTLWLLKNKQEVLWHQLVMQDHTGLVLSEANQLAKQFQEQSNYAYDDQLRLVIAEQNTQTSEQRKSKEFFYAWNNDGSSKAYHHSGTTTQSKIERDPSGLPTQINNRKLTYNHHKRIERIEENGRALVEYEYDVMGRRIGKNFNNKRILYFYLGNKLVGEWTTQKEDEIEYKNSRSQVHLGANIHRRYIYAGDLPIAFIDYPIGSTEATEGFRDTFNPVHKNEYTLYYIHSNHIGQPIMVTDEQQKIHWLARYTPTGEAEVLQADIELNLRAPGQYYDKETGWHDNYLRTYDPQAGHYLEPDPLGPLSINDPYGYAAQQPRRYIDPEGLLLFAFDGTSNDKNSNTNVLKFFKLYDGAKYYTEGPGALPEEDNWDKWMGTLFNTTGPKILETHKANLLKEINKAGAAHYDNTIPVDIVGFSRGAVLSMAFSNFIDDHTKNGYFNYSQEEIDIFGNPITRDYTACIDLRFIGLFDAVSQKGLLGFYNKELDYSASESWSLITHAVALNEHRKLFPLTTYQKNDFVVEQAFMGNHTDLGGVHLEKDRTDEDNPHPDKLYGDLGNVPLAWVYSQAQTLGIPLKDLHEVKTDTGNELNKVKNPVLHNSYGEVLQVKFSDRHIQYPNTAATMLEQARNKKLGFDIRKLHSEESGVEHYSRFTYSVSGLDVGIYGLIDASRYLQFFEDTIGWTAPLEVVPFTPVH